MTDDPLDIAILGAGALGSLFGGLMALAGHEVRLVTTNRAHREAIAENGLALDLAGDLHVVKVDALAPDEIRRPAGCVMLFTKTHQTHAALTGASGLLGGHTQLVTVQNGLGNLDRVRPFVPGERVVLGTSNAPADFVAPGRIATAGANVTRLGAAAAATEVDVPRLVESLNAAGLNAEAAEDVHRAIWEKAAFNVAMNPLLALARATPGHVAADERAMALGLAAASEACAVAAAEGSPIDEETVHEHIRWACANHPHHKTSMRQDMDAGKPTEIDALCGEVTRRGERHGIATPVNDALWRLVALRDAAAAGPSSAG